MKGDVPIQIGVFRVDKDSWFDVRRCDGGIVLSLCEEHLNLRYTVIVEGKKVKFKEVAKMNKERTTT